MFVRKFRKIPDQFEIYNCRIITFSLNRIFLYIFLLIWVQFMHIRVKRIRTGIRIGKDYNQAIDASSQSYNTKRYA